MHASHRYRPAAALLVVLGVIAGGIRPARSTTLRPLDSIDLLARSDAIVVGHVLSAQSHWTERKDLIVTDVTIAVDRAVKGQSLGATLIVRQLGGRVDGKVQDIDGVPRFEPGQNVLLFLNRIQGAGAFAVRGLSQGKVDLTPDGGRMRMSRRIDNIVSNGLPRATKPQLAWQYLDEFLANPEVDLN